MKDILVEFHKETSLIGEESWMDSIQIKSWGFIPRIGETVLLSNRDDLSKIKECLVKDVIYDYVLVDPKITIIVMQVDKK